MTTPTLDDFLQLALDRLERAALALPERRLAGPARVLLVGELLDVLDLVDGTLRQYISTGHRYTDRAHQVVEQATGHSLDDLQRARQGLQAAAVSRSPVTGPADLPAAADRQLPAAFEHLSQASRFLRVGREVLASSAQTPYGPVLDTIGGRLFLLSRLGDVTERTRLLADQITRSTDPDLQLAAGLRGAVRALGSAAAQMRSTSAGAPTSLAALPPAPLLSPAPVRPDEDTSTRLREVAAGAERLQAGAYRAAHGQGAHVPVHAAALRDSAAPLALAHLLAGNLVRATTADLTGHQRELADQAAADLRAAARAWQETATHWRHLADPDQPHVAHRPAPPHRHPLTIEAETAAVRLGRVLYTDAWLPTDKTPPQRPARAILEQAGAPGPVLGAMERMCAASAELATQAPKLTRRLRLITDDHTFAPPKDPGSRWFAASAAQRKTLADSYQAAAAASSAAMLSLTALAAATRVLSPRAQLDAAARLLQARPVSATPPRFAPPPQASGPTLRA